MFEQLISYQAGQQPDGVALVHGEDSFTFGRMAADIGRCAAWLATLDLPLDARALLSTPHPYLHWVLTFALEQSGLVSASSAAVGDIPRDVALLEPQVLFASVLPEGPLKVPTHRIDQAWIDALWAYPPSSARRRRRGKDDPCRIIVTSGTTGSPKKILLTREVIDVQTGALLFNQLYVRPRLRAAATVGAGSIGGLKTSLLCWAQGGTMCHPGPGTGWAGALGALDLNLIRLAPHHLQTLLRALPDDFAPMPDLIVGVIGGSISKALAEETRVRLSGNIVVNYGSTEAGATALGRLTDMEGAEDAAGFVCPWAEVQIVGPDGEVLPPGQMGEIRIGGSGLAGGYMDDPEATAQMFRDGWFWPGDLGMIDDRGLLRVVGRTNDLMNVGGAKFLASRLEALVLAVEGVCDAAAFLAPDADGLDAPHLAYVAADGLDLAPLTLVFERSLGRQARLLRVAQVPRNAMGKIQRDRLRQMLAAAN
ncbi:class I adenylate-forming enzyme family protein [Phenylobacterium sp.]|uniref:class I adenylate-forming enzyme family protein n=1 Tax=Phenylobacterium sp. TaxID=1871053 RepID=UPI002726D38B|nr:class I adenylate-forming enzyme family protein [Phenylobacterium sp.]MDO8378907.1 class I adenylate-forming enzyme family protein [Phenylobacterium sp.]